MNDNMSNEISIGEGDNQAGLLIKNLPDELFDLVQRWNEEKREFYLGPENIFFYGQHRLVYENGENIPTTLGSWKACTRNSLIPRRLSSSEIDEIQLALFQNFTPKIGLLTIDYVCNLHCPMCPYHGDEKSYFINNFSGQRVSLDTKIIRQRIKKMAELGVRNLQIGTDGEIFIRKDWEELWDYTRSLNMKLSLTTNGTLLDEEKIIKVLQYKDSLGSIKISLNALTFDTWSQVSGSINKKFYENAVNAVKSLAANHIRVVASMVASNQNAHEVGDFVHYWGERQVSVQVSNFITTDEFLNGSSKVNNLYWPYYFCESINNVFMVGVDGHIVPCCRTCYCLDDANSSKIPLISIDESADIIKEKWAKALADKAFRHICKTCTLFSLRADKKKRVEQIHGYKGTLSDSDGFHISMKKKKSLPLKGALECKRFFRRIKKFYSKG